MDEITTKIYNKIIPKWKKLKGEDLSFYKNCYGFDEQKNLRRLSTFLISRFEDDMDGENDDELQERIDELNEEITDMDTEIEDIKEDPEGDFPDELIDEIITDKVNQAKYDIEGFMNEWGLKLNEYIDKDEFIKAVIDEDGYGTTLNGYDGNAEEITIQNELFYVLRID